MALLPYVGEPTERELEVRSGEGLDARFVVDLETLDPAELVLPVERFYLRTGAPLDLPGAASWTLRLSGLVGAEVVIPIADLLAQVQEIGVLQFECSGNSDLSHFGLMSAGRFAGVPAAWLLAQVQALPEAVAVRVTGCDEHAPSGQSIAGAAWVYRLDELAGAWFVTHQDGAPIPPDHGAPVRLLVPGWYGCANLKWVEELVWVDAEEPATSQMTEFASRVHQDGVPTLARDYSPAEAEISAVVVRVEQWDVAGERRLVAVGVVWGGVVHPGGLRLWMDDQDLGLVETCPGRPDPATWGAFSLELPRDATGEVTFHLTIDDDLPARRLDDRYYDRTFDLS